MAENSRERAAPKQLPPQIKALGQGPVAKILQMFGHNPPNQGAQATLLAYSRMPWLRAINDKIGGAFSSLRWRAFVKVEPGEKGHRKVVRDPALQNLGFERRNKELKQLEETGELVELPGHAILTSIYNEGDNFTGVTLRELSQKYLDLVGEAFWIKVRNSEGMPTEFLPVPPHWVTETPSTEKPWFSVTPAESYEGKFEKKIPPKDMIWFYHPDPFNPYKRGIGMGTTLGDELETDEYAAKFLKSFFYNSARPDFLIHSENLEKDDTVRLEQRWMDKLRGTLRGFTPFFSNRKLEITRLTADYGHLQMLELRAAQRDVCLQVYGAQPEIFGITEASNRATSEVAEYLFSRWVIVPRAEFFRSVLQLRLVPEFDESIILTYDSPIMQDKEHDLKVASMAPWALSLDEWREMMDKRPLSGGLGAKVYCKPLNYEFFDIDEAEGPPEEPEAPVEPVALPAGDEEDPENETPPEDDQPEGEEMPDEEIEESLRDEFFAYLEEARGIAWVSVREMEELASDGDYDAVADMLRDYLCEIGNLERAIQIAMMRHGLRTVESVSRWCPKDAKLEAYGKEAHDYLVGGSPIVKEFIKRAVDGVEDALPRLMEVMSARKAVETLATYLGLSDDQWNDALLEDKACVGEGLWRMNEKLVEQFPERLLADALSYCQLMVAKDAIRSGYLGKSHVERRWILSELDAHNDNCIEMKDHKVSGSGHWETTAGDTVVLPTRSHPDCHCREKLVINGGEA